MISDVCRFIFTRILIYINLKNESNLKNLFTLFDRLHLFAPRKKSTLQSSNQKDEHKEWTICI